MKMLHRLVGFLVFVVLVGFALLLVWTAMSEQKWAELADHIRFGRFSGMFAGIALFCLGLLLALTSERKKSHPDTLFVDSEKGRVSIDTDEIGEYVAKLITEFPSVVKMRPNVIALRNRKDPSKNSIDIVATIEVKAGPQIHEACEILQDRIRDSVVTGLGITRVRRVDVTVGKILSEHRMP